MKKLIAFSVVFALLAGAAFADTSVSGTVETRWTVFSTSIGDESPITAQGIEAAGYAQLQGQNDDGTFGATVRIRAGAGTENLAIFHKLYAWWKPVPMFRFWLGRDPDGVLNTNELGRWSFHSTNDYVCREKWDWDMAFPGNWDEFGAWFQLQPMPGVDLNLVLNLDTRTEWQWNPKTNSFPAFQMDGDDAVFLPERLQFVGSYVLPDLGKIYLTFRGAKFRDSSGGTGLFGASFLLTSIDGLKAQLGVSTGLPDDSDNTYPLYLGLTASYVMGEITINFRSKFKIPIDDGTTQISAEVLPMYALSFGRLSCAIGFDFDIPSEGDSALKAIWVNPVLKVGNFYVGLKFENNGKNPFGDALPTSVSMPLGLAIGL